MKTKITNLVELRTEIVRLKGVKKQQQAYLTNQIDVLQDSVKHPFRFITGMFSSKDNDRVGLASGTADGQPDWITKLMKVGLPFMVNKMLFPKAGYVKRLALGLVSSKAAGLMNQSRISSAVDSITSFFKPKKKKRVKVVVPKRIEQVSSIADQKLIDVSTSTDKL